MRVHFNIYTLFYSVLNLSNTKFDDDNNTKKSSSKELVTCIEDSKTLLLPKNDFNSQLKPLGDINIKIEDIIPCMYSKSVLICFLFN